jgi:hypothetical protein
MIAKSLFAAAALAATMVVSLPAPQAKADVDVEIGIGVGGYVPGYYGYGYGYAPRPAYRYGHGYRAYERYDEGITCNMGRKIVYRSGFRDVRALDCHGPGYRYAAWKRGQEYVVRVNEDGVITRVRRVY